MTSSSSFLNKKNTECTRLVIGLRLPLSDDPQSQLTSLASSDYYNKLVSGQRSSLGEARVNLRSRSKLARRKFIGVGDIACYRRPPMIQNNALELITASE